MQRQVIRGGRILDLERADAPAGDMLIGDGVIIECGPPGMAVPDGTAAIDATDHLLMPGLVNAHTHGHGSLGKGHGDRWTLELLLNASPWLTGGRTLDDKRLAARLNAAEMVMKGCTACFDLYFEFPTPSSEGMAAVAEGYLDVGMRAVVAPMMADRTLYEAIPGLLEHLPAGLRREAEALRLAPYERSVAALEEVLRDWRFDRDRVRPAIAPTIPHHCSEEFLTACRDLARHYGVGVHMHLAESRLQTVVAQTRYGQSLTAYLDRIGLLSPGFVGAHCVWFDDDDIGRFADRGAAIAHQPGSNLRLGSGIAPVRRFLDAGVPVGIGTDGSNSSDNQNMFEALRLCANVSRVGEPDYRRWISARETLAMATRSGDRLLGFGGRIGALEAGRFADIVFLDLRNLNYVPLNNAVQQIVNCEDSSAVDHVMVGGTFVLQNRAFTTFDVKELRRAAAATRERLDEKTAANRDLSQRLEQIVGSYCVGLAHGHSH